MQLVLIPTFIHRFLLSQRAVFKNVEVSQTLDLVLLKKSALQ